MGREALANPNSRQFAQAKMDRARWLIAHMGREAVEAKLPEMPAPDQRIVQRMLDELFPLVLQ